MPSAVESNVKFDNYIRTTLPSGATAAATSIVVASTSGFPTLTDSDDYYYLVLHRLSDNAKEIVKVTAVSGTTLTVTRGQDGTDALLLVANDRCEHWVVAKTLDDLRDELAAAIDFIKYADPSLADHGATTTGNTTNSIADLIGEHGNPSVILQSTAGLMIVLRPGTYVIDTDLTLPRNITLRVLHGAYLQPASGNTLTIEGLIEAALRIIAIGYPDETKSPHPTEELEYENVQMDKFGSDSPLQGENNV